MTTLYEPLDVIHDGTRFRVRRARMADGTVVALKQLRNPRPSEREMARFRREYDMLLSAAGPSVPRAIAFEVNDGVAQIVMEYIDGVTLGVLDKDRPPTLEGFLRVAVSVAEAIDKVHTREVLHRDINPTNIVVNRVSSEASLVDFGLASRVTHGMSATRLISAIEGTPAYIAPEQTGRMNRAVDVRSDLYALGATLYEMVSGQPPFVCADLLEYVHAHLARAPAPLKGRFWALPSALSDIVMTLLAKRPEDRYQSAAGVALDLRRCLKAAESHDTKGLTLVGRSLCPRIELPQDLYGREEELGILTRAFESVVHGNRGVALISGEPGIGKTSLVFELQRPATVAGARMLLGKFDQFTRDVPFAALGQALGGFFSDVLSEPMEKVTAWSDRFVQALGPNGKVLTDVIPGAEALLGTQAPVQELAPTEAEQRLQETLRRAIRVMAQANHPVVLFLDDLQWADLPSLRLLETLFRDPDLGHLLLIGAWRDTDVASGHALIHTVDAVRATGAHVEQLHLGPLRPTDVEQMLGAALRCSPAETTALAAALHDKTLGNPFFLRRLVEELGATQTLRFDRDELAWRWDLAAIRDRAVTDNVVTFLRRELEQLPEDTRRLLSAAAWIGARFDLSLLAAATGVPALDLLASLRRAIDGRFVLPDDEYYWDDASAAGRNFGFSFIHDRIQQAAGELLSPEETDRTRLAIARAMHARSGTVGDAELFRVAEHFTAVIALVTDPAEHDAVVGVVIEAGRRAMQSAAYGPAHKFLEAAVTIAGPELWNRDPTQARALYLVAARAAWLVGDLPLMTRRVEDLRAHTASPVDRLNAEWVIIQSQIARLEINEGITAALAALEQVGVSLPRQPTMDDVMASIGSALAAIGSRTPDELAALPIIQDEVEEAARRMMVGISAPSYVAAPNLLPLLGAQIVIRSVQRGVSRESSYGFSIFALSLCAGWHLAAGYAYGRLALRLLERLPDPVSGGRTRHVAYGFVLPWTEPLRNTYTAAAELSRSLLDVGDLEYAGWALNSLAVYGYSSGTELSVLGPALDRSILLMQQHRVDAAYHCTIQWAVMVRGLRGLTPDPTRIVCDTYDEDVALAQYRATGFRAAALCLAVCGLMLRVVFRDYAGAVVWGRRSFEFQDGALAIFYQCSMRVYATIAELSCIEALNADDRTQKIADVKLWRREVVIAAERAPANAGHLLALMDAEIACAERDVVTAIELYDTAIALAARNGFTHDEALAGERAALYHAGRGARTIARAYLQDARFAYQRWGASAKVDQLDKLHTDLVGTLVNSQSASFTRTIDASGISLDLDTIVKASQAISGEVALDKLLTRAMRILLENVGARKGVLLLRSRGGLSIEAQGLADSPDVELLGGIDFEDGARVPPSIVRRVWRRGIAEVFDDVMETTESVGDPYLQRVRPRSVLCAPIQHQGRARGVVYFENELSAGAFTTARVRVLDVLSPQLAISIENARLHAAQDRFVPYQFLRSLDRSDIIEVELGDHAHKEVSVFFSDIRGFTPLIEKLAPADALRLINSYFAVTEPAIQDHQGFVDTYLGDGLMALFDGHDSNADDAVACAVAMQRALAAFNTERAAAGQVPMRTGIGINTGMVMLATLGGGHSLKCGVVGDPVNLAARVEGLTKRYEANVLISEFTAARLRSRERFSLRTVGRVRVVGREQSLTLHEVIDGAPAHTQDALRAARALHERSIEAFFAGDLAGAREGFKGCLQIAPEDFLPGYYLRRIEALAATGIPEGWDGVEVLAQK